MYHIFYFKLYYFRTLILIFVIIISIISAVYIYPVNNNDICTICIVTSLFNRNIFSVVRVELSDVE